MTERDLTRVLTDHVSGVHLPDEARRNIRRMAKEDSRMMHKKTFIIALAVVLMLMSTTAIAAGIGILGFGGGRTLPGAEGLVTSNLGQSENEYATYIIKEAVYDGRTASILVEITPKDERTLIIPEVFVPEEDLFAFLLPLNHYDDVIDPDGPTIAEYAAKNGFDRIVTVGTECFSPDGSASVKNRWEDNTIKLMYQFETTNDHLQVDYYHWASENGMSEDQQTVRGSFTLTAAEPLWTATSAAPAEAQGMTIHRAALTGTELAVYVDIEASGMGEYHIALVDELGGFMEPGFVNLEHSNTVDGRTAWCGMMPPLESAPDVLHLQLYTWDDPNDFILLDIPLL